MASTHELLEAFCRQHSYDRKNIYAWTEKVDAQLREFNARLEALEKRTQEPDHAKPKGNYRDQRGWLIPGDPDNAYRLRIQDL